MVPYRGYAAIGIPHDHGVGAVLDRIRQGVKLRGGHVGRVKIGAERPFAVTIDKRLPVKAVPRAVVDH